MHHATDAVPHVLAQHAVAMMLGQTLDGMTDVAHAVARHGLLTLFEAVPERDLAQGLDFLRGIADVERPGVIPTQPSTVAPGVNRDDVAVAQG